MEAKESGILCIMIIVYGLGAAFYTDWG
jgi:hypothetical protein